MEREEKRKEELELKRIHGAEVRHETERQLKEKRTRKVMEMIVYAQQHIFLYYCDILVLQEKSKNFVTPENLEEKIEEAIANEVSHNFALSTSGHKIEQKYYHE